MGLAEIRAQHLRLTMLKLLADDDGAYSANESILHDALVAVPIEVSRDQVRVQIAWLAEHALVTKVEVFDMLAATITKRGRDVANGHASVPGVKRPSPRD